MNSETNIKLSAFVMGFTAVTSQIILLRIFFSLFGGNELVIGAVIGIWGLYSTVGAMLSIPLLRIWDKNLLIYAGHLLFGILPVLTGIGIYFVHNKFVFSIASTNLLDALLTAVVILAPIGMLTGIMLTFFSIILSELNYSNRIIQAYSLINLGGIAGGILFNFLIIFVLSAFSGLVFLLALNVTLALVNTAHLKHRYYPRIISVFAIVLLGVFLIVNPEKFMNNSQYKNHTIIDNVESLGGNLNITEFSGEYMFYENNLLLYSTENKILFKEKIYETIRRHPNPQNILVISGGTGDIIQEVLKFGVNSIDYLDLNPTLISLNEKIFTRTFQERKVQVIEQEARTLLAKYNKQYDIVFINLPDPINSRLSRYYTINFFEGIKSNLANPSIVSTSLSSHGTILNPNEKTLHSALYSTLKLVFENVVIIPGIHNYFLASDGILGNDNYSLNLTDDNSYGQKSLNNKVLIERQDQIMNQISNKAIVNYDFSPISFYLEGQRFLYKDRPSIFIFIGLLFILFILGLPKMDAGNICLLITGFSAVSLQLVFIVSYQLIFGNIYFMLGILIFVFLGGTITSPYILNRRVNFSYKNLSVIQYLVGIFAIITPFVLISLKLNITGGFIIHSIFILFTFIAGVFSGLQFISAIKLQIETVPNVATASFRSNSLGATIGALLASTLLIPGIGIIRASLTVGIINFIVGLWILIRYGRRINS